MTKHSLQALIRLISLCISDQPPEKACNLIPALTENIGRELDALDCSKTARRQINVALDELLSNIANYAYAPGTGPTTVRMRYRGGDRHGIPVFPGQRRPLEPPGKA